MILEGMSYEEIVAAAYSLEAGLALEDTQRLYGTVTKIDTPWSDEYKNITVTIQVGELADQPSSATACPAKAQKTCRWATRLPSKAS